MTNFVQKFIQDTITWAFQSVTMDELEVAHIEQKKRLAALLAYYQGDQRRPLKVTLLGKDYNTIVNLCRVVIDRSVSMLFGPGFEFDLPGEGETKQGEYIARVWDVNKKDAFALDLGQHGSTCGTPFIKIVPNGRVARDGQIVPRLVALNPFNMTIEHAPDDIENVLRYVFRWNQDDTAYREITEKVVDGNAAVVTWQVYTQKADSGTKGQWVTQGEPIPWEYEFSPIAHGKNLPRAGSCYGASDIEDVIELQDRYNEAQSNTNKILALQAWAQKYIIGGKWPRYKTDDGKEYLDVGPDKALEIQNENAKIGMLQPSADLASSRQFGMDLRRDIFEISGTTDTDQIPNNQLTNFGVRVLYKNELAKNATKRLLYGDLFCEVNYRLLRLAGYNPAESDPGKVTWGDPLPTNEQEQATAIQADLNMGIVSKQTAAQERGYDWEAEQERISAEKTTINQDNANVGGQLIRNFLAGRGTTQPARQQAQERAEGETQ